MYLISEKVVAALRQRERPRVVIFRALMLGDLLCSVPAFRAIRQTLPHAEISLLGLPWSKSFADRFANYFDRFIEFPGFPGLPERSVELSRIPPFLSKMQQNRHDLAIQMHGSGSVVNPLVVLFGAQATAGYYVPGEYCPDERHFLPYPEGISEVERHLRLVEFLGAARDRDHLEFPITTRDEEDYGAVPELRGLEEGRYACIHPGARFESRRWLPDRFAAIGDFLHGEGLEIVITGSGSEKELANSVGQQMHVPHRNVAGKTSLGALAFLLSRSRLVVSNDTGISHLSAAVSVPSVIVTLGSDPVRWAPLNGDLHRIVMHSVDCRPCDHVVCPIGHPCAAGLTTDRVLTEVNGLLDDTERESTKYTDRSCVDFAS